MKLVGTITRETVELGTRYYSDNFARLIFRAHPTINRVEFYVQQHPNDDVPVEKGVYRKITLFDRRWDASRERRVHPDDETPDTLPRVVG